MENKFEENCLHRLQILDLSKHGIEKEKIKQYGFFTKSGGDITYNIIKEAEKSIDRQYARQEINKYLENEILSIQVERGLFENSLISVIVKKFPDHFCFSIYMSNLYNICYNLDQTNENINNQTLCYGILNGEINPLFVAFLSPQQMHPKRWENVIQKKLREDDAMYNIETTDEFTCSKCGESKSTVEYVQLRSADEPASKFVVCVICGFTVIL